MRRLLLAGAVFALAACQSEQERQMVNGQTTAGSSGDTAASTRDFAHQAFTAIELRGPDDVEVTTGETFSVSAKGKSDILDKLDISVTNGVLQVSRRKDSGGSWFNLGSDNATVHVVMPRLDRVSVAGSGDIDADRGEGDFEASVSGSGSVTVKQLQARAAKIAVGGSGDIELGGTVDRLEARVSGSGNVDVEDLIAKDADIAVSGSGGVDAHVTGAAAISVSGSGNVELKGGARCTIKKSGSGKAVCS